MGLEKPVLYIDVPPKSRNTTWPELGIEPFESFVRDKTRCAAASARVCAEAPGVIRRLVRDPGQFRRDVANLRRDWMYNLGRSGEAGAEAVAGIAAEMAAGGRGECRQTSAAGR